MNAHRHAIVFPKHVHTCPGVAVERLKPHLAHNYACYNPSCVMGDERYCGLIVDALWLRKHGGAKHFDPKYL